MVNTADILPEFAKFYSEDFYPTNITADLKF